VSDRKALHYGIQQKAADKDKEYEDEICVHDAALLYYKITILYKFILIICYF
jgi:hypothetical protein